MKGLADPCRWCGQIHSQLCPAVRALEFHPDGSVKRVEFHAPEPLRAGRPGPFDRIGPLDPVLTSTGAQA